MKFYESDFSQYLNSIDKCNIHPKNNELYKLFHEKPYHIIIHGPSGIGKYSQSLKFISSFSNSNLKYQKKLQSPTIKINIYSKSAMFILK